MIIITTAIENSRFLYNNVSLSMPVENNSVESGGKLKGKSDKKPLVKTITIKPAKYPKRNWDHEEDNCGINPDENPCGDANEY
jgi:hypothetical protein